MKNWTKDEERYLVENYNKLSRSQLCDYFDVSKGTLNKKARKLGLKKISKWTKYKEDYLLGNYRTKSLNELAKKLEVSVALIRQKKFQQGLTNRNVLKSVQWTEDSIVEKINKLFSKNEDLSASRVKRDYPSLYSMARNYYKSWREAVRACGIDYDSVRKNSKNILWSKEEVINQVRFLFDTQQNLSSKYNSIHQKRLWNAANYYFFTWRNAIEAAELDYDRFSKNILDWNAQKVKNEILKIYDNELPLFASYAKKNYARLYGAASTHFSGWKDAIEFSGLDYNQINKRANEIDWNPSLIKDTLLEMKEKGESLSESVVLWKYPKLRTAARRMFGCWEKAIIFSGLDINEIRKDIDTEAYKGHLFEKLAFEILLAVGRSVSRHNHIKINNQIYIPDFIDNHTGNWIDVKLSSWGHSVEKTIKKYLNVQEKLEIIFLNSGPRVIEKVDFICIKNFYPKLRLLGRSDLIEQINSIK